MIQILVITACLAVIYILAVMPRRPVARKVTYQDQVVSLTTAYHYAVVNGMMGTHRTQTVSDPWSAETDREPNNSH